MVNSLNFLKDRIPVDGRQIIDQFTKEVKQSQQCTDGVNAVNECSFCTLTLPYVKWMDSFDSNVENAIENIIEAHPSVAGWPKMGGTNRLSELMQIKLAQ